MRNKKILFITNDFGMGGAEKVLLDIVGTLIAAGFEVEVLAFFRRGVLKDAMQEVCTVHTLFESRFHFLIIRKLASYRRFLVNKFVSANGYDFVVGFLEGQPTSLLADITISVRKIAWVHNDFQKLDIGLSKSECSEMYYDVDEIVCVSKDAEQSFFKYLPEISVSSRTIYNLIDEVNIGKLSLAGKVDNAVPTFLSVGMLRKQKCHDRLVRIASRLKKLGYEFQIQIIGGGPLRKYLEDMIRQLEVGDNVALLGMKANPYPYIRACDCFVLASDFEGYGIVIKESLFLKKMVLTTAVVGPREILENGKYGLIVDNNEDALFVKMKEILDGTANLNGIKQNVSTYRGDNEKIKQQLCELFA